MENATNFLTAWGCPTNEKDFESGFTSLHLAVLSGNARVVRRVLIKGGDKTIKVQINFGIIMTLNNRIRMAGCLLPSLRKMGMRILSSYLYSIFVYI